MTFQNKLFIILFILILSIQNVDAFWLNTTTSKDTWAYQANPDQNYGTDTQGHIGNPGNGQTETYLFFDLSSLPKYAHVTSAQISMETSGVINGGALGVYLNIVDSSWNETNLTWNNRPTNSTNINITDMSSSTYSYFNVTTGVQDILNNVYINNGFVIYDFSSVPNHQTVSWLREGEVLGHMAPTININYEILLSPSNSSIIYKQYPPLTESINFTWSSTILNSNLIIAKDLNFNLISVNTTISNNFSVQSLEAGNYWWKVRYYNSTSGTYGSYSNTFNFTISNNISSTGTGIQGVVYELVNGVSTPVSNARVIIRNDILNWTSEQVVGPNGYFIFSGLTNSTTYNIYATKSDAFKDSVAYYVTTGLGTTSTQNVLLERCVSGFDCFYNQAYVKITVKNMMHGTGHNGVTINVFEGDGVIPIYSGTTKTDGSITFLLKKDQNYRITAVKSSENINVYLYLVVGNENDITIPIWSFNPNRDDSVSWNLSAFNNNATTTYLNLTYSDISGLTTAINFWVLNSSNQSQIICSVSTAISSLDTACAVNDTVAITYIYGFNATRNGEIITENKAITFYGSAGTLIDIKIESQYYNWISIIFLVGVSLLFSKNSNRNGYVLIPLLALLLSLIGWFTVSYLITSSTLVIGVLAYLRSAEKKSEVGY